MNKQMKQHLTTVVTSIVNEDTAAAKQAFHEYLSLKTQQILGEESKDDEEVDADLDKAEKDEEEVEKDTKKLEKDEKEEKKDIKKAKKDQKKDVKDEEDCK